MRTLFVTGTDTGVGKTYVSCLLLKALAEVGVRALPFKPVAAGAKSAAMASSTTKMASPCNKPAPSRCPMP